MAEQAELRRRVYLQYRRALYYVGFIVQHTIYTAQSLHKKPLLDVALQLRKQLSYSRR